MDLCWQVMSLLLNKLSRLVITLLPRSKWVLILWLQSPFAMILEPPKIKSVTVFTASPQMWELDHKEGWALKNWYFRTVVLEKTLESPLDSKEIQLVHPKGNQSWIFIGRTDAEAETPILWPPDVKSWLIGKDLDAGKDWGQEEKGTTEDDGWMASLTQWTWVWVTLAVGDGQPGLSCCISWGAKELDLTGRLNWTELGD